MALTDIANKGRNVATHRPWPRAVVGRDAWGVAVQHLVDAGATMLGLWGDKDAVHLALLEEPSGEIGVVTLECPDGKFPSVAARHPAANRLERAIASLYGLKPIGAPDTRPWLDLGFWGVTQPLGKAKKSRVQARPYEFLPVEGENLHQIPVGPVHAGIIEPGHFRFTANGEAVARLEQRLGYVHKGIESLMAGASLDTGAQACRPHLGRQHRGLRARFRAKRRVGASARRAAARHLAPRADGRARAHGQSFRRYRRDLQRRVVLLDLCRMRHLARAHLARRASLLRPSIDDGPHRAGRRGRRSRPPAARLRYASCSRPCAAASPN